MGEKIKNIEIQNFKKFQSLTVNNIGQFNLIVGDNNVGKTSFLEALLFDSSLQVWLQGTFAALRYRYIEFDDKDFIESNPFEIILNNKSLKYIQIITEDATESSPKKLRIEFQPSSSLDVNELQTLNLRNLGRPPSTFSAKLYENGQIVETDFIKRKFDGVDGYFPLLPSGISFDFDLVSFYTETVQKSKSIKSELIQNLALIVPEIENIEISGSTFVITLKNEDETQIIRQYGEGTTKLLRILLEVLLCQNKRIMIDEFGSGIHYSRLQKFYELILKSCIDNEVQLFATTHSEECIKYFANAAENLELSLSTRVIKLAQTQSGIKAYTSTFDQFSNALDAESELR
jgi:AAA15 family ATPase/GTPase